MTPDASRLAEAIAFLRQVATDEILPSLGAPWPPALETPAPPAAGHDDPGMDIKVAISAVEKLRHNHDLTPAEQVALEVIVIPGQRPAIDIIGGDFTITHPAFSSFDSDPGQKDRLRAAIASVGRIEVWGYPGLPYAGTGFVVGQDLLMTARHVAELFGSGVGRQDLVFRPGLSTGIDFARERDQVESYPILIRRIVMIHPFWNIALLQTEPLQDKTPLQLSLTDPADLVGQPVAVIGYPAFDPRKPTDLEQSIFRGVYNIKRIMPGVVTGRRTIPSFGHDVPAATHDAWTLGGTAGSPVFDPSSGTVLGIHFASKYLDASFFVPASELARDARVVDAGVWFVSTPAPDIAQTTAWWATIEPPSPFSTERFLDALNASETPAEEPAPEVEDWYRRAAVLAWFEAAMIGAPSDAEELLDSEAWLTLIADCEVVRTARDGRRRRLCTAKRRQVLTRMHGRPAMRAALAETTGRQAQDPVQRALDQVISDDPIDLAKLSQADLYAMHVVAEWLDGIVVGIPAPQNVAARLRREELLQPHRILAGDNFVGRRPELDDLRGYVEELPTSRFLAGLYSGARNAARWFVGRPPLVIYGPGGVGKSSLVAKFILEHSAMDGLVFIDLDFGRPNLDPRLPTTLLAEAARQIATQVPAYLAKGDMIADELEMASTPSNRGLESVVVTDSRAALDRFARFAAEALPPGRNIAFILDTFEEVQALGATRVEGVWTMLRELQQLLPQLRPVICSRVQPAASYGLFNLELRGLEPAAAESFLAERLLDKHRKTLPESTIATIISRIACTPLGLNLAADVLAQAIEANKNPIQAVARIIGRADEAFLYQRILQQIKDPALHRLATPGLAVRRLDVDVVMKVLAQSIALTLRNRTEAEELLEKMAAQVGLVERDPDGALRHRPDVRTLMLPAIEKSEGVAKIRKIDRAAADFYAAIPTVGAQTERAYHLLRLGALDEAEAILTQEIAVRLRGALDELDSDARLVLGLRLDITPGPDELRAADDVRWERGVLAASDDLLQRGAFGQVLELVSERPNRRRGTTLDRIEAEAALGVGDVARARHVAESGLDACEREGHRENGVTLALVLVRASLLAGNTEQAADAASRAEAMITRADSPELRLRVIAAGIAVGHATGNEAAVAAAARNVSDMLDPITLGRLQPAILRTLAAQLSNSKFATGDAAGRILRAALRRIGIEQKTDALLDGIAAIISAWMADAGAEHADVRRSLSSTATAPPPETLAFRDEWRTWLTGIPGPQLGQMLAALLKTSRSPYTRAHAEELHRLLGNNMAQTAQAAIEHGVRRAAAA